MPRKILAGMRSFNEDQIAFVEMIDPAPQASRALQDKFAIQIHFANPRRSPKTLIGEIAEKFWRAWNLNAYILNDD